MMTASQRAATGVRLATVALRTFTSALITTGVGALVVALGFLVSKMFEAKDVIASIPTALQKVDKAMLDTTAKTEALEKDLKSLAETREEMSKLSSKEGKDLKENSKLSYQYNQLKKDEKIAISNINKVMKIHNKDLINEKDSIQDITTATNTLIEAMNKKAYANIYTDMRANILKNEVEGDLLVKQIKKLETGFENAFGVSKSIASIIKDVEEDFSISMIDFMPSAANKLRANRVKQVNKLLEEMGMTITEFKESVQGGSFDNKIKDLEETISAKLGGMSITDLLSGESEEEEEKPESKSAQFEINEMIRKREVFFRENNAMLDNDKLFNAGLLEAKIQGVKDYLAQENNKKDGIEIADRQLADLLRKQRKANKKETLDDLKTQSIEDINLQTALYKNKIISEFDYNKKVIAIKKQLLADELAILEKGEGNEKKIAENKSKALTLDLQLDKINLKEKERLAKQDFDSKVTALELEQSTTMMSKVEFDNRMLQLELEYLNTRKNLYETGALELIDINNGILANNISVNEQQKELMQEQISAMGGVGSALTSLAGDNESLNFVKEAGNKISMVANTLSTIASLNTNLETLSNLKKAASENVATGSTIAGTVADTLSLIPKAIGAILNQGKGDPYSSFFRMIAMTALVAKVMGMYEKGGIVSDGKKFADGGMVHGPSHAQGGVKFAVGGRVNE
jgi:hypothetical protein